MSDNPSDDFAVLARRAQRIRDSVTGAQSELATTEATGHGGGGLVRATVSGRGRIVALDIDPSVIDPQAPQTLSELVIEAVDAANEAMAAQRAERMNELTGGLAEIVDQLHGARLPTGRVAPITPARRPGSRPSPLDGLPLPPGVPGPNGHGRPSGRGGTGADSAR
ncbi:hypothetical protein RVR_2468 [Actinacidiphila reveromycinica]|uniref:Nucleoid-associated protein RVR_2468 n=1 Tax=Actinacidiphila reveromycinica TaxID=659352 RepID=A0A7U3UQM5_9ACTN|nr:YbaB/EbfC family nucleoid-associated protein [Streptomyces sp. SN-593]BBA96940.1 hypothetical protein RVR_2468 [Streptomyces sp. SN-593]